MPDLGEKTGRTAGGVQSVHRALDRHPTVATPPVSGWSLSEPPRARRPGSARNGCSVAWSMPWVRPRTLAMMEDSAVTYVAQVPGRHSMRMATSGVAVLAEFLDKLEGVGRPDRAMGSIKQRARGVTAGEVLVGLVTDPKVPIGVRGRPTITAPGRRDAGRRPAPSAPARPRPR